MHSSIQSSDIGGPHSVRRRDDSATILALELFGVVVPMPDTVLTTAGTRLTSSHASWPMSCKDPRCGFPDRATIGIMTITSAV
jgi:hypothetical protein